MTPEKPVSRRRAPWPLLVLLPLLAAMGCQAFDRFRESSTGDRPDPLTGLPPRSNPDRRGISMTATPPNRNTPASLAATSNRGGDDLRISEGNRDVRAPLRPTGWTGAGNDSERPADPANSHVASSADSRTERPTSIGPGPGPRVRTFEDAQQFLMTRGVRWQRLETTGEGEWKFSCSIPSRPGSTNMRTYEGRDRYGLIAMQHVIDQIVRDQQK